MALHLCRYMCSVLSWTKIFLYLEVTEVQMKGVVRLLAVTDISVSTSWNLHIALDQDLKSLSTYSSAERLRTLPPLPSSLKECC